jgi:TonB family protein
MINISTAQSKNVVQMDTPPIYPGCENSKNPRECFNSMMKEHIRKNFNYPIAALIEKLEGKVLVQFTIDSTGTITNIKKRGPNTMFEIEAERIINLLPRMTPATYQGKNIKVPYSIPMTFKITRSELQKLKELKRHAKKVNEDLKRSKHY